MFENNEPLLEGIRIKSVKKDKVESLEIEIERDNFDGWSPKAISDVVGLKIREKYGDRVLTQEVKNLVAVPNGNGDGKRKVTFTYVLYLKPEQIPFCYVEIDGKQVLLDI